MIGILNDEAKAGDTVVAAAGSPPGDLHKLWDVSGGAACHLEFGFSCMGYEIPAGLGVRMAQPQGEVFVFIGDGTYLMNPTELVTASQEGLKITLVISENHGFQCIRQLQMGRAGHSFGNEFRARDQKSKRLEGDFRTHRFCQKRRKHGGADVERSTPEEDCAKPCGRLARNTAPPSSSSRRKNIASCRARGLVGRCAGGGLARIRSPRNCGPSTRRPAAGFSGSTISMGFSK